MNEEEFQNVNANSKENVRPRSHRRTGAKKVTGKKVALTILILGGMAATSIFGTKAVHSIQETKRVDKLINAYTIENYVELPNRIATNRAYDATYADGEKVVKELEKNNIEYININGKFYTKDGINIQILTYDVTYEELAKTEVINGNEVTFYMTPSKYSFHDNSWRDSVKYNHVTRTIVVPADLDLSQITFNYATNWELIGTPIVLNTLPFSVIEDSTLICDVPDNATLNEFDKCEGTLELAPKKH